VAVRALTNAGWGFESNCFVCEPKNTRGLQIPFFHDDEGDVVTAEVTLDRDFSGVPQYLHGGVLLSLLDEAMAWATIAVGNRFAVTREMHTTFARPVRVGLTYRVEARLTSLSPERIDAESVILDHKGRACVTATAEFFPLSEAQAVDGIGSALTGDDAGYVERGRG
jgi:uncharacterized protein (TIGR00369 family)